MHASPDIAQHDLQVRLSTAYLTIGFMGKGPLSSDETDRSNGEIGAIAHLCEFVAPIVLALERAMAMGLDHPGVFEYEVTEPMGAWIRENPDGTMREFCTELAAKLSGYFTGQCAGIEAELHARFSPHPAMEGVSAPSRMTPAEFRATLAPSEDPVFDASRSGYVSHGFPQIGAFPWSYEEALKAVAAEKGVALTGTQGERVIADA